MGELTHEQVIERLLVDYVNRAETVFRREVQANDKVLTGELLASIRAGAIVHGKSFIEGHIHFDSLLRVKDMKTLNFTTVPPLEAMVKYVEKIGSSQFPIVYGYKTRPKDSTTEVYRIASSLQFHFKRVPNVRRGYRGLYNDPLRRDILPQLYADIRTSAGAFGLTFFREIFSSNNS